ncbi:MAG: 4-(cytidine 5'-diphospho)-2-C-methyl-D-erythritol kinase [Thermodesulfobacteriota bacterium]|nr:4-(cytidine 5'-diphospho)-2-C-methyl-D-erythritol kinase [Thermodesulfobacteriota bacterium]
MDSLKLLSPAKINLTLEVLHKRNDGYHEIRTIMQRIDLCDEVEISLEGSGLLVRSEGEEIPQGAENIVYHAARLILEKFNIDPRVRIFIKKRIPVASGLAGGSSNAATTLVGLNKLFGLELTRERLMKMGKRLGADVPFFLFEKPALATGIGDILKEITLPSPLWIVLVNPGIRVSTAWAYKNVNMGLTRKRNNNRILPLILHNSHFHDLLYNDLETVTIKRYPEIQRIKEELVAKGAVGALMSGSGSTVFGIFPNKYLAEKAFLQIRCSHPNYSLFLSSDFQNPIAGRDKWK